MRKLLTQFSQNGVFWSSIFIFIETTRYYCLQSYQTISHISLINLKWAFATTKCLKKVFLWKKCKFFFYFKKGFLDPQYPISFEQQLKCHLKQTNKKTFCCISQPLNNPDLPQTHQMYHIRLNTNNFYYNFLNI